MQRFQLARIALVAANKAIETLEQRILFGKQLVTGVTDVRAGSSKLLAKKKGGAICTFDALSVQTGCAYMI
jgi:hypothetical protein